jgi:hypothetical protein
MGVIKSGHNSAGFPNNFGASDAVTADALNDHVNDSTFNTTAVDDSTIEVYDSGAKIRVKDDGVTFAKMQNISTDKVLGRTTAGSGAVEEVDLLDEDDMASDSDTAVATQQSIKAYIDKLGPLVTDYIIYETQDARNNENNWRYKNFAELTKSTINTSFIDNIDSDGSVITFASTGTYLVELVNRNLDLDSGDNDTFGVFLGKGDVTGSGDTNLSPDTTIWSRGTNSTDTKINEASVGTPSLTNQNSAQTITTVINVSNLTTDKLQVVGYGISGGTWDKYEAIAYLKITKLT